jgi:hypothetical protein
VIALLLPYLHAGTPVPFELNPVLGILIGVVAVLLVVAIVIVGALRVRAQNRGSPSRPGDLALKEKAALPLRSDVEDLYEMDDKNPDVIPCNKGKLDCLTGYWLDDRSSRGRVPLGPIFSPLHFV